MSFNRVETALLHISIRSLMTVAGMGGVVVLFIEGGTGRFLETMDRLAQASDLLQGMIG